MNKKKKILHFLYSLLVFIVVFYVVTILFQKFVEIKNVLSHTFEIVVHQTVDLCGNIGLLIFIPIIVLLMFFAINYLYYISKRLENSTGFPFKITQKYYRIYTHTNSIEIELLKSPRDDYYKYDFLGEIENERAKNILSMSLCEAIFKFQKLQTYRDSTPSPYNKCCNLIIYSKKPLALHNVDCFAITFLYFRQIDLSALLLDIGDYCVDYYKLYEQFSNNCYKLLLPETDKRKYAFVANEINQYIECYPLSYILGYGLPEKDYDRITFFKFNEYDSEGYAKHIKISEKEYYNMKNINKKQKEQI